MRNCVNALLIMLAFVGVVFVPPATYSSDSSTNIELSEFYAVCSDEQVTLFWETETEINNAGFNIHRSETENEGYAQINDSLIPAEGSAQQGSSYDFFDTNVQNGKTYYYKLEDLDLGGTPTMHGPVFINVPAATSTTTTPLSSTTSTPTTTTTIISAPCAVEAIYGENSDTTKLLRQYRNEVLSKTPEGLEFTETYYKLSPPATMLLKQRPLLKDRIKALLDRILPGIRKKIAESSKEQ